MMRLIYLLTIISLLMAAGCSTPFLDEQNRLYWERQQGHITEAEYQNRLKQMKDEQPWGGIGGANKEPPPPFAVSH
jgi:hypothetical protein